MSAFKSRVSVTTDKNLESLCVSGTLSSYPSPKPTRIFVFLLTWIPQIPKMWDLILVTPIKTQPYYSQSSRENAPYPAAHPH